MKQKRWLVVVIFAVSLLLCIGICFTVKILAPSVSQTERKVSIQDVYPFLKEGEIFSLSDAFPFDWDEVLIANAPGGNRYFYTDLQEFDASFSPWHDIHFLVVFYLDGKIVEYFQYLLGTLEISPVFSENHQLELNWEKRILRENARFVSDGFQNNDGVYVCTLVSDM